MKTGFLLVVGLSVLACGCSKKPSVDAGAVAKVAMAKYPGRHFAPWDGSEGVVQMNAQLAQLKVPEVGISGRDKKYTVTVTFTSTSPENIAPRVFVSAYDLNGNQIGRWGVVTHMSEDLNPGITDRTADTISWETETRPVLIAVDDDGTKPKATVAQGSGSVMAEPVTTKPPGTKDQIVEINVLAVRIEQRRFPGNGVQGYTVCVDWQNRGSVQVAALWGYLLIWNSQGKLIGHGYDETCIFAFEDNQKARIGQGAAYYEPSNLGFDVYPTVDGIPVKAEFIPTRIETR